MPRQNSAAYIILTMVVAFLVMGFVFTVIAQPWSAVLDSQMFSFETSYGQDLAAWTQGIYDWAMLFALIAMLMYGVIRSRRATP